MTPSPYEVVLGGAVDQLAPSLRRYFGAIPPGHVGRGHGVFEVVGTPRRWLWPLIAVLGRGGAMFPVWERAVPFDVVNRPVIADGHPAVSALRTFHLRAGEQRMHDVIAAVPVRGGAQLVDLLGRERRILVLLDARVDGHGLRMRATGTRLRLGPVRVAFPHWFSPRLELQERRGGDGRQHLSLTIDLPLIGRVYEYAGAFDYEIVPDG